MVPTALGVSKSSANAAVTASLVLVSLRRKEESPAPTGGSRTWAWPGANPCKAQTVPQEGLRILLWGPS